MKKIIIIAGLLLVSTQAAAYEWIEVNLISVKAHADAGRQYITFDPVSSSYNCNNNNVGTYPTTNDWKVLHSTLLAALLAEKTIVIRFDGCHGNNLNVTAAEVFK